MELTNSWIETGMLAGALVQGERMLLRQFNTKFGTLNPGLQKRIIKLNTNQMEDLSAAIFKFDSLADAEAWLDKVPQ